MAAVKKEDPFADLNVRRKSSSAESYKLKKPGDSLTGILTDMKVKNMVGKQKEPIPTRLYFFRLADGRTVFLTGKSSLDDKMDELTVWECGLGAEEGGITSLFGFPFRIERGEDIETRGGNTLGTYEVTMYDKP